MKAPLNHLMINERVLAVDRRWHQTFWAHPSCMPYHGHVYVCNLRPMDKLRLVYHKKTRSDNVDKYVLP